MKNLFSLNENIRDFEKVILVTSADGVPCAVMKLLHHNIKVDYIGVSSAAEYDAEIFNIPVADFKQLLKTSADAAVVVMSPEAENIVESLERMGFHNIFFDHFSELGVALLQRDSEKIND
ncbi:MAG: hypothetical protein FWF05_05485 [Oscillospiraceae bacterium]|nr:hypothetical protein [Oscillospiraceae bacterium]